jgi:5-hydroxyisourate hydrolase
MISTHILDTNLGKPAAQVEVKLFHAATHELIATAITNQDGRVSDFGIKNLGKGAYQLEFEVALIFHHSKSKLFSPCLYPIFHRRHQSALPHSITDQPVCLLHLSRQLTQI